MPQAMEESASPERAPDADSEAPPGAPAAAQGETPEIVRVEPPDLYHDDWRAWFRHLEEYSRASKQLIRVREVMSCVQRNKRLSRSKSALRGERLRLVPEEWHAYQRTYICTHGWRPRYRGENIRQRRQSRYTECPFRFIVQVVERGDDGWCLKVKNGLFRHNHNVDDDRFGAYPMLGEERSAAARRRRARQTSEAAGDTGSEDDAEAAAFEAEEEEEEEEEDHSYEHDASAPEQPSTRTTEQSPAPFASPPARSLGAFASPPGRSSIGSRRVSLSSNYSSSGGGGGGGGDELEWESERRRRAELEEREAELRVESLRCDNVLKRIKIVEESMLARKRLKDAGISESELDVLIPVVAVQHPELDATSGLRQLRTLGQTPEKQS